MHATLALSVLALAASAIAAPLSASSLVKRDCATLPSSVDPDMRDEICSYVRSQTSDAKILLITMVTAYTESMVNNLKCGDQDSVGLFQQRPSQGWGTVAQLETPSYAIQAFMDALSPIYKSSSSEDAGILAQAVQGASAGNQYTKNEATAQKLIDECGGAASSSSSTKTSSSTTKTSSSSTKTSSSTTKTSSSSTETSSSNTETSSSTDASSGAVNVGSNPSSSSSSSTASSTSTASTSSSTDGAPACAKYYTPVKGDNCYRLTGLFKITLNKVYELNPQINDDCTNLYEGEQYCVAAADS